MQITETDDNQLSLKSFWGLFVICGASCIIALAIFSGRIFCQFRRFSPENEESDNVEEIEPARPRRSARTSSFKNLIDFVDKKEAEIKEMIKRRSSDKKQSAAPSSDGQVNSTP